MIFPKKIGPGSHIRIVAPSRSIDFIAEGVQDLADKRLKEAGFQVSFGKNVAETNTFNSSSVFSRVQDLHEAFIDTDVDAILTVIGGCNANQLLKSIDYKIINSNPKIFCGFSDITVLQQAFLTQADLVTYYGPHFSSWGMEKGFEYSLEYFLKCCSTNEVFDLAPSLKWSDDLWFLEQKKREFSDNDGFWVLNEGTADGKLIGGHLSSLNSLQGTEYFPSLKSSVIFIEETKDVNLSSFNKKLQSLILQPDFNMVRGMIIGRFQKNSRVDKVLLREIIKDKPELCNIPIVANVDFGHTTPVCTLPIGGRIKMEVVEHNTKLDIIMH